MKNSIFIASFGIVSLFVVCCTGCNEKYDTFTERSTVSMQNSKIEDFEKEYIASHTTSPRSEQNKIALIGYSTIAYHGEDSVMVTQIWKEHEDEIKANGSFLALDGRMRIYFPMRDAIVSCEGQTYVSDSCGYILIDGMSDIGKISVLGRNATDKTIKTIFAKKHDPEKIIKAIMF